jgi:hypothetical protein
VWRITGLTICQRIMFGVAGLIIVAAGFYWAATSSNPGTWLPVAVGCTVIGALSSIRRLNARRRDADT